MASLQKEYDIVWSAYEKDREGAETAAEASSFVIQALLKAAQEVSEQ